ncbi:uncharacterized protein A4U43_C08F16570 [Asparagus officinalis]|nr:uncharacterized protein A4U43_C08F16570 [Asparagus officinalis]
MLRHTLTYCKWYQSASVTPEGFNPHESCLTAQRHHSGEVPRASRREEHRVVVSEEVPQEDSEAYEELYEGLGEGHAIPDPEPSSGVAPPPAVVTPSTVEDKYIQLIILKGVMNGTAIISSIDEEREKEDVDYPSNSDAIVDDAFRDHDKNGQPLFVFAGGIVPKTVGEWSSLLGASHVGTLASPRLHVVEQVDLFTETTTRAEEEAVQGQEEESIPEKAPLQEEEMPIPKEALI